MAQKKWKRNGQLLAWPEREKKREHILEVGLDGKFAVPKGCHVPVSFQSTVFGMFFFCHVPGILLDLELVISGKFLEIFPKL